MTRSPPWSEQENRDLIALYFQMLDKAAIGTPYNKAAMIRREQTGKDDAGTGHSDFATLANRSKQSIEFKLMNASAAHAAIDPEAVTMHGFGYRAMPNYQAALKDAMALKIETRRRCYIGSDTKRYA